MDLVTLTSLVIEKIKDANGYSELDPKALHKSVHGYLEKIYKKHFYNAQKRLEDEEARGIFPSQAKYKKEYDEVEDIVMVYANKLAATTKDQV